MARQKSAWDKLSMSERAQFIKLGLQHGLSDLKDIKDIYNLYSSGGDLIHKYDGEQVGESSTLNLQIPTMPVDNTYVETPQQLPITFLPTKGDYKVLDRNAEMYFTQQLRHLHQETINKAIAELNTIAKVKEVQTLLAEAGAYDKYLPTKKEDIKKLQRRLIALGLLPEEINGRKQEDGLIGKNTINAWRKANIDGILGQKTKNEYKKLLDVEENADWGISVDGEKDYCARFVSNKIEAATGQSTKTLGVYGNGWNMLTNIVNKGGIELFNIYKNKAFNNISSPQELKTKTNNYLAQNKLDYSKLEPGDVVGIYIPSSLHHQDVLQSGSTYNTHVGVIVGTTSKGEPIVEHTINDKVYQDPISNIRGNVGKGKAQITVAARPNYAYTIPKIKLDEEAISKYQIDEKYTNEAMSSFMKGMAEGAEAIHQIYPEVPMDVIQEIAIAVQKRETNFMTNRVSDQGFIVKTKDAIATKIRGEERKSTNTSKMKLGALTPYERAFLDIHSKEDLEDPKKAGLAAELYLAKNYDYFKRLQQKYPELGITDEDIKAAVILSYNQGMSKLYSLGFDANGNIAHQELEELRKLADINTRIKDISSTNYRFLGDIGEVLYNAFEDPYQPYISAALEASNKYIHRMTFGGPLTHKKSGKEYGEASWLNNGYNSSEDWQSQMRMKTNQMLQNLQNSPFYMTDQEMQNLEVSRINKAITQSPNSEIVSYPWINDNGEEIIKTVPAVKGLNTMWDAGVVDWMPVLGDGKQAADALAAAAQGDYRTAALLGGLMFVPNIIEKPLKSLKTYAKNVTNRAFESALRIGDLFANNPFTFARQMFGNKGSGLRYVFTGQPQLAYQMPYRYSGQVLWSPDNTVAESAHMGDLIDVIMGKTNTLLDEYGNTLGRLTDDISNVPYKTIAAFQSLPGRSGVLPKVLKFDQPTLFPEFIPKTAIQEIIDMPLHIPMEIGRHTKAHVPILQGGRTVSVVDPGHYGITALKTNNGLQLFGHDVYHYTPKNAKQSNFSTSWMPNIPITVGNPFIVEWQIPGLIHSGIPQHQVLPYFNVQSSDVQNLFHVKDSPNIQDNIELQYADGGNLVHKKSGVKQGALDPRVPLPNDFDRQQHRFILNHLGQNTNIKSTGGPLYPFSFEKNPFLKTPVVRYDEGGDMSNEGGYTDKQLSKNQYVWNRFDPTGRFYIDNAILSAKYGNLARGEENEYWKAYLGLDNSVPMMRVGANTEWDQQIENEKLQQNEPLSDFYGTTPRMDYNIQALADTLFLGDMYRNYNTYSQEYKDLPSQESIGTLYEQAKTVLNNPNQWISIDGDDITLKYYNDFDETSELNPLGMLAHFGLKWVPEQKSLFMHDTYDFPKWVTWLSSIPNRPKEMKIRSQINFDPNKGSWLLRNAANYNQETPAIKSGNK